MKFAFDIDGVLCTISITTLRMLDMMPKETRDQVEPYYYREQKPLLNPELFLASGDEYIVITGRSEKFRQDTEIWLKKFCPNCKKLIMANLLPAYDNNVEDWSKKQAELKAKIINEEKIDVYFEDNGTCVEHLRGLSPNTKIIQYGGRIGS